MISMFCVLCALIQMNKSYYATIDVKDRYQIDGDRVSMKGQNKLTCLIHCIRDAHTYM